MMLTPRQVEVLQLIADGHALYSVGYQLGISYGTVKAHRYQIRDALQAKTMEHAVAIGLRKGIIT